MVTASARRDVVSHLRTAGYSERRSCRLVGLSRSSCGYAPRKPKKDQDMVEAIQRVLKRHKRYGYRRVWAVLRREGHAVNVKRIHRLFQREGFSQRRKVKKHRATPTTKPATKALYPNHVWTYDIIEDRTASGNKLRILSVLDEFTRECRCLRVERSINAKRVVETLEFLFLVYGRPKHLRSDNGGEFAAIAVKEWLQTQEVAPVFIEPGSPWENGYVESFHDKFRKECLNMEIFRNGAEARIVIEAWREHYNTERPHSSLGYLTPTEFAAKWCEEHGNAAQPAEVIAEEEVGFIASLATPGAASSGGRGIPKGEHPGTGAWQSGSALGSLPSVALSSAQPITIVTQSCPAAEARRLTTNHSD